MSTEQPKKDLRKAWDPETMGYGRHSYTHVDPDAINVADFAINLRGEQQHRGDVREESTAYNEASSDNSISLDLLSKIGTVFETEALGLEGIWMVAKLPLVRSPEVFCRAYRAEHQERQDTKMQFMQISEVVEELSCVELGCAVDTDNKFRQVKGKILYKGKHQNLG